MEDKPKLGIEKEPNFESHEDISKEAFLEQISPLNIKDQITLYSSLSSDLKVDPDILSCVSESILYTAYINLQEASIYLPTLPKNIVENIFADFDTRRAILLIDGTLKNASTETLLFAFALMEYFPHLHTDEQFRAYVLEKFPPTPDLFIDENFKKLRIDIPDYKQMLLWNLFGDDFDKQESVFDLTESDVDYLTDRNRELYESPDALKSYPIFLRKPGLLVVNPPEAPINSGMRGGGGLSAIKNNIGGFNLSLEDGKAFTRFHWITSSLTGLGLDDQSNQILGNAQYRMDIKREMLSWETDDDSGILLISSDFHRPGVVSICKSGSVEILDMSGNSQVGGFQLRKPVIYLYPDKGQEISVELDLKEGKIIAEYPKRKNGLWSVLASPCGDLTDLVTGKKYSYLFWEAERETAFEIDYNNYFCVAGSDSEQFLEKNLEILGLNDKERNDFIVYWLPLLEKNRYNLISFLEDEYTETASLTIKPTPTSIIRVFMVFKSTTKHDVITPKLKKKERSGFAVIEWGGMNLDDFSKALK